MVCQFYFTFFLSEKKSQGPQPFKLLHNKPTYEDESSRNN